MAIRYGHVFELPVVAMQVSSVAEGRPWDNAVGAGEGEDPALEAEIRRFMIYVEQPQYLARKCSDFPESR